MEIEVIAVATGAVDHVGRVEPAAEPDLQHQQVGRAPG